jgi:hypothetical protein
MNFITVNCDIQYTPNKSGYNYSLPQFETEDAAWLAGQAKTLQRVYAEIEAEAEQAVSQREGPDLEP